MLKRSRLVLMGFLLFAVPSWGIVEVRMTYTGLMSDPDKNKIYSGTGKFPDARTEYGLGVDLIFDTLPSGIGIGLRYENLGLKYKNYGLHVFSEMSRNALLLNWRLMNSEYFLGPILTYGFSHSGGLITVKEQGAVVTNLEADRHVSYSAGLEAGAVLGGFRLGAEAGYMYYEWGELQGSSGNIPRLSRLDMGGPYLKLLIGFGI
ncbi:MAG: hypothetical protein ACK5Y2_12495 [Bdellovibrionales bacterium]